MKSLFAVAFLFFVSVNFASAQAEKGSLSGKVVDEKNEAAGYTIVGAYNSKDSSLVRGTMTTIDGDYTLDNLAPGNYYVQASIVGYEKTRSQVIQLAAGSKVPVALIQLKRQINNLKEVSISTTKPLIENQVDKTVMNIENSVLAAGNNALELLEKAPGVIVDKDGKVSLRGKSGVQVMIDGKPTYLSQDQLANLLRSTEGNNVQSIEIMTNPSAKYDASGNSGIINIKMKKNQNFGTNGTLTLGGGYGRYHKAEASTSLNHRQKLFNFFGNYSYGDRKQFNRLIIEREINSSSGNTFFNSRSLNLNNNHNHNYKAGVDFFLNSKNTLGFMTNGNIFRGKNSEAGVNRIGNTTAVKDSAVIADNKGVSPYDFSTYNINYKSVLDTSGTELTANLDYSRSSGDEYNNYISRYTDVNLVDYRAALTFRNSTPTVANIYAAKVDFAHPFSKKTKLEAGLKSSYVKTDNNLIFDLRKTDGTYVNDPTRSNRFKYTEVISAGYVSVNTELFKNFTVQAGLRAENTHSEGFSVTTGSVVTRDYLNIFPTIFLKEKLSEKNSVGASYSRRIDRPDYGSLNPFVYYIDQYAYNQGNPYLNPQYTDSYELNYTFHNSYIASVNYSHTGGAITEVLLTNPANKALFQTMQNLATQNNVSLNMSAPLQIAKWWKTNNNLTVFHANYKTPNLNGSPFESNTTSFTANTNQSFTFGKTTSAELSGNYISRQTYGVLHIQAFYGIDLGVSQSFADKKFNLKLGVSDIFNTRGTREITGGQAGNTYYIKPNWENRVVRLTASWRFGNSNVKAVEKSGGAQAEQNRLKQN